MISVSATVIHFAPITERCRDDCAFGSIVGEDNKTVFISHITAGVDMSAGDAKSATREHGLRIVSELIASPANDAVVTKLPQSIGVRR